MKANKASKPVAASIDLDVPMPMILSPEFRWVYYLLALFLMITGVALVFVGGVGLFYWGSTPLTTGVFTVFGGFFCLLLAIGILQARQYFFRIRENTVRSITHATLGTLTETDFEQIDRLARIREEKAQVDFERNVKDAFLIKSFHLNDVAFFGKTTWQLQPGVNILLGRNGYGKSLIVRALAALLQRDEVTSADLFNGAAEGASLEVTLERNGTAEHIRREGRRFTESSGRIPILAIPDSRFVNRRDTDIEAPTETPPDLLTDGARHFLEDRPYGDRMRILFNELCFDYLQNDNSFDDPVFAFLENVIRQLTDDTFKFSSVERIGPNSFRILVITEGNKRPLPLQYVSQGTLSVLGVVGIIRSYLKSLAPLRRGENCLERPAIVLIDELDAHLHPLWQQRLTGILRTTFPNVQFVLTAHSPLVVQGCWKGEVSVLRRSTAGLTVELLVQDFLGTSIEAIYKDVFRVEGMDPEYAQSASRATTGFNHHDRIAELDSKQEDSGLNEIERRERNRLVREDSMTARAKAVSVERTDDRERIIELEAKIDLLNDKLKATGAQS